MLANCAEKKVASNRTQGSTCRHHSFFFFFLIRNACALGYISDSGDRHPVKAGGGCPRVARRVPALVRTAAFRQARLNGATFGWRLPLPPHQGPSLLLPCAARSMGATEHERQPAAVHARGAAAMHSSRGICSPFCALQLARNLKPRHLAVTATWSGPEAFRRGRQPVRPFPFRERGAQTETAEGASGSRAKRALPAPSISHGPPLFKSWRSSRTQIRKFPLIFVQRRDCNPNMPAQVGNHAKQTVLIRV